MHVLAYFDILGYKSFLESNSATVTVKNVFDILEKCTANATDIFSAVNHPDGEAVEFNRIIVSDTIILSIELPNKLRSYIQENEGYTLLAASAILFCREMFDYGLPIRGALHIGQFVCRDQMIAGRALVEAHKFSESIDFSGVCMSPEFEATVVRAMAQMKETNFETAESDLRFWNSLFPHYLCPLKNGQERRYRIGLWTIDAHYERNSLEIVRECFWKWGKEIPNQVDSKVNNTAKCIDYFKINDSKIEDLFEI